MRELYLDSPFGEIAYTHYGEDVRASCRFCEWNQLYPPDKRKRWSTASRARIGLQRHALAAHKNDPEVKTYAR